MARPSPVRGRRSFEQLRVEGMSARSRLLSVRAVRGESSRSGLRVSYAIGRHVGTAVVRNRVRRRLRSLVAARHLPDGEYLVSARAAAVDVSYVGLGREFDELLGRLESRFATTASKTAP